MGTVYSYITRPIRSFNIENRTARILGKEKPIPAPEYPSAQRQREVVDKSISILVKPNLKDTQHKKDHELDDRLKSVFVQSKDPEIEPTQVSSRPLPQNRSQYSLDEYYETLVPRKGKCTIKEVVTFLTKHQENEAEYSIERISQKYQIDKQTVENILTSYKLFHAMTDVKQLKIEEGKKK
ncbi:protein NDUFAF4 homolog isoform X1 [Bombus pyrosoma]|uniref:protein NDUFAF4 homolog isoform X1 n=1 Tax=Bombus pyrosoma TaxID=396416 RepID=UPI001CB92505|nr:protein NDUFAF4 homolog isoform X1 [Bombus pyrosoma]XP_043581231.1 protein NDUFAF4 homolog isoform X1 [Bombus pyrosoma]XP_043581232.1 protein NDUFAF4 homolog isoform X1 [Bombus pyrosoma]XP_043581233.1 protein NDUFAF4 homolog isoform X1 [Bombus pyrosoma]